MKLCAHCWCLGFSWICKKLNILWWWMLNVLHFHLYFAYLSSTSQHARPYNCCWLKIGALKLFIDLCFFYFLNILLGGGSELEFLQSLNDKVLLPLMIQNLIWRLFNFKWNPDMMFQRILVMIMNLMWIWFTMNICLEMKHSFYFVMIFNFKINF